MKPFEIIVAFKDFMKKNYPENKIEFGDIHLERFVEDLENPLLSQDDYQFLKFLYFSKPEDVSISKDCMGYIEFESYGECILTIKCKPTMFQSLKVGIEYDLDSLIGRYEAEAKNE